MRVFFLSGANHQSLGKVTTFINRRRRILVDEVQWVECLRGLRNQFERIENDDLVLNVTLAGGRVLRQLGREAVIGKGKGIVAGQEAQRHADVGEAPCRGDIAGVECVAAVLERICRSSSRSEEEHIISAAAHVP